MGRSFLGVNMQYVENGQLVLRTLAVKELFDRHTGAYLKTVITDILKSFGTSTNQIYTCTTDSGTNMIKAISLLNEDEIKTNDT